MDDFQLRFEALRLAHGALCSGKFTASELPKYTAWNYEFLKAATASKKAKPRK